MKGYHHMIKKTLLTGACIILMLMLGIFVYGDGDDEPDVIEYREPDTGNPDYDEAQGEINELYNEMIGEGKDPHNPSTWDDEDQQRLIKLTEQRDRVISSIVDEGGDPSDYGISIPGYLEGGDGSFSTDEYHRLYGEDGEIKQEELLELATSEDDLGLGTVPHGDGDEPTNDEILTYSGHGGGYHPGISPEYINDYLEHGEEMDGSHDAAEGFVEFVKDASEEDLQNFIFETDEVYANAEERINMIRMVAENEDDIEISDDLVFQMDIAEFSKVDAAWMQSGLETEPFDIDEEEGTATMRGFEVSDDDEGVTLDDFELGIGEDDGFYYTESVSMTLRTEEDELEVTSRFTDDGEVEITEINGKEITEDYSISDALEESGMDEDEFKEYIEEGTRKANERAEDRDDFTISDAAQRHHQTMRHKFAQEGRSAILGILNSWTSKWLGDFSMRAFAAICGDTMYVSHDRDTRHEGIFGSLRAPGSDYESKLEEEATGKDKPTVVLSGERNQVGENLYRYGATMKLIGNQYDEWSIYLYNSCTKENSYDDYIDSDAENGWTDYGSISLHRYINNHYAGHRGQSMIFDCQEENCRFDQVCVVFESTNIPGSSSDNKEPENLGYGRDPYCVTLTHGEGFFTQGETGSYDC